MDRASSADIFETAFIGRLQNVFRLSKVTSALTQSMHKKMGNG